MNQAVQVVQSAGCGNVYTACTFSIINGQSLSDPFLSKRGFDEKIKMSNALYPGSYIEFSTRGTTAMGQPQIVTTFDGTISELAINSHVATTPQPPAWTMMLIGLAGFGFAAYRRKSMPVLMTT